MSDPFIGEIRIFGFSYAPYGWAFCDGSIVSINQYQALFAVIGTRYGGDGKTTFGLPDLRGKAAMHWGTGPGLTARTIGQSLGADTVTLLTTQIPGHVHQANGAIPGSASQLVSAPTANAQFSTATTGTAYQASASPPVPFSPKAIGVVGGSQPHANNQPRTALNFCIAMQGLYPSRN